VSELLITPKLFDQILKAEGNVLGLATADVDDSLLQFRQLAVRSGQSVYLWTPENGISSMRETDVHVPGSRRLADALRFILQSLHFGVYLFTQFEEQLKPPATSLLRRIARIRTGNERKLLFVASALQFPDDIDSLVERVSPSMGGSFRPRLRDGRWVT